MTSELNAHDALASIAAAWRIAYTERGGSTEALALAEHATRVALGEFGGALLSRQNTVRMVIDVVDLDPLAVDALAASADVDAFAVRKIINALLDARGLDALRAPSPPLPDRDLEGCPFCDVVHRGAPATIVAEWPEAIALVPLDPVVDGHVIVVPRTHVEDFTEHADLTGVIARRAAQLAVSADPAASWNLIASAGVDATQSVFHLHMNLVPRHAEDGLALPWSPAPVGATATRCAACGMRIGYVNHKGTVLGWGCADPEQPTDPELIAPQLATACLDFAHACLTSGDDEPIEAFLAKAAADPRVGPDAAPAMRAVAEAIAPMLPNLFKEGPA